MKSTIRRMAIRVTTKPQATWDECYRWKRSPQRLVSRDAEPDLPEPEAPAIAESLLEQLQEEQILREPFAC